MTPDVERLRAEQNGVETEVLGNLLGVDRVKLLAVFAIKQLRVFRLSGRGPSPPRTERKKTKSSPSRISLTRLIVTTKVAADGISYSAH
jgi:hypothetical protein